MSAKFQTYADLQKMIRKALREQHPEWVDANGKCALCDLYEARFAYLLGEGDEQKAPLGRAVIRGFLLTTVAVLFFVPVVFSMVRHTAFPHMADADFHSDQTELPSATSIRREIQ